MIDTAFFSVQKAFGLPAGLGVWIANEKCLEKAKRLAKYDGITLDDQVHQYHLQSHLNLPAMQLYIYEYNLAGNLQEQIKTWRYYKKTINNLCKELNIPEDIERMINRYF